MGKNKSPISKTDTKLFLKKTNQKIHQLKRQWLVNLLRCGNNSKINKEIKSLKNNKYSNSYPKGFIENHKKVAVYTALFGNYDRIKTIKAKNPLCDYYIFTDQNIPEKCGWTKIDFSFPKEIENDPVLKNRFLKMHPHLLFPNYEYSIYLDAVLEIDLDIYRLMSRMGNYFIGLFDHHANRNCIYEEANVIQRIGKASEKDIKSLEDRFLKEGFPSHFGLCECTLIIREHNNKSCIKIMNDWWHEFLQGIKRDQLYFMYVLWRNEFTKKDIAYLGATYWIEPIFSSEAHIK